MRLTTQQIKDRHAMLHEFRKAIFAAIWQQIEVCDQSLLCADDGEPYGEIRTKSTGVSALDQMATGCTEKAIEYMRNWL